MTSPEQEHEPGTKPAKYQLRHNKPIKPEPEDKGPSSCAGPKKRGPKPRLRSAGMSRYRRKEANARERQRQGEINTSFDKLREKIPHPGPTNGKCEKLRKIDILHVAINYIRALENILESGDPGVHHFANSVYKVGRDEGGAEHGSEDQDSDAYSEDGEAAASPDTSYTQHSFTQHSFADTQPSRSQRKITLTSRDDALVPGASFRHLKKHFPAQLTAEPQYGGAAPGPGQLPAMQLQLKMEMVAGRGEEAGAGSWGGVRGWAAQDMSSSLLSDFSDMSSSDPETDIFLPDLSSSLESLHNIEAFNFFNEKQNLAF